MEATSGPGQHPTIDRTRCGEDGSSYRKLLTKGVCAHDQSFVSSNEIIYSHWLGIAIFLLNTEL